MEMLSKAKTKLSKFIYDHGAAAAFLITGTGLIATGNPVCVAAGAFSTAVGAVGVVFDCCEKSETQEEKTEADFHCSMM